MTWHELLPDNAIVSAVEFEVDSNLPRMTLRLRANETLKVYAKTHARVRFEFEHKRDQLGGLMVGRSFAEDHEFQRKLLSSRVGITERYETVLSALQGLAEIGSNQRSLHSFILAVIEAVRDRELYETIIALLVNEGRIVRERGRLRFSGDLEIAHQDRLQAAADRLREADVLVVANRNASHWTVLVPAPEFRDAVASLRRPESQLRGPNDASSDDIS